MNKGTNMNLYKNVDGDYIDLDQVVSISKLTWTCRSGVEAILPHETKLFGAPKQTSKSGGFPHESTWFVSLRVVGDCTTFSFILARNAVSPDDSYESVEMKRREVKWAAEDIYKKLIYQWEHRMVEK
jgi:hypothetical protein